MDLCGDEESISQTIDVFLKAVDTSDLAILVALPLLDFLDDAAASLSDGDDDEVGSAEGVTILPYTESDDEEMESKYRRCRGDCHSALKDIYTTCKSHVLLRDTMMGAGSGLHPMNPLLAGSDEEEEADHYEDRARASREMFAEWRDLEDRELDEYLGNVKRRKKPKVKVVAEVSSENSDVDIEAISDSSTDYSSDVDIENVNPGMFSEIRGVPKRHSPGNNVLRNSISLNFHNYAMSPQSVFRFTGKPESVFTFNDQISTSKFNQSAVSLEKLSTSALKTAITSSRITPTAIERNMPSVSRYNSSSIKQHSKSAHKPSASLHITSTSELMTSLVSKQMASSVSKQMESSLSKQMASSVSTQMTPSTSTQTPPVAARRGRPRTTFGTAKRGRPPVSASPGRRRSAMLVAAAMRRPVLAADAVRNFPYAASPMTTEHVPADIGRKQDRLNMLERSRRRKLSDLLEELRLSVPSTAQLSKASKTQTLTCAIDYIRDLQTLERRQNYRIEEELQRHRLLLRKLNSLKSHK